MTRIIIMFIPGELYLTIFFLRIKNYGLIPKDITQLEYPPLVYAIFWIAEIAFNSTPFGVSILILPFDIGTIYFIFLSAKSLNFSRQRILLILYFYAFSPITIINFIFKEAYCLSAFFTAAIFYFFLKKHYFLQGVFGAIVFSLELGPLLVLMPFMLQHLAKKEYNSLLKIITGLILTVIALFLSLTSFDIGLAANYLLFQLSYPSTESLWNFLIPRLIFDIGSISISIHSIVVFIGLLVTSIFCYNYFRKHTDEVNIRQFIYMEILFFAMAQFLYLSYNIRYIFWVSPIFCLLIHPKPSKDKIKNYNYMLLFILAAFTIIINYFFPSLLFLDLSNQDMFNIINNIYTPYYGALEVLIVLLVLNWFFILKPFENELGNERQLHYLFVLMGLTIIATYLFDLILVFHIPILWFGFIAPYIFLLLILNVYVIKKFKGLLENLTNDSELF